MTVSSDLNRISYSGNGSTTVFPVNYYFLEDSHLQVILITAAGVETIQTLTTNYTVSGAGNPAGGSVTMLVAPPTGTTIVIQRDVPATQETDYLANDPFPAESHERALDKLTMLVQQNEREADRALKIPLAAVPTTSTELPLPEGNKLLAWNSNASAVTNFDPSDVITIVGQQTSYGDVFTGNGVTTDFTLTRSPGSVFGLDVSINGVTQVPNVDYILAGTTLTFTSAPPAAASQILARYAEVYEEVSADAQNVRYLPAGTGAQVTTVQAKLRETVSVKDFGAVGDGVTDDTAAIQAAIDYVATLAGGVVNFPDGNYLVGTGASGTELFLITHPTKIVGGVSKLLVDSTVPNTCDIFRFYPSSGYNDGQGYGVQELSIIPASTACARYAINIDSAVGFPMKEPLFTGLRIALDNGFQSIYMANGGTIQLTISDSFLRDGIYLNNCPDNVNIERNIISRANYGIWVDMELGSTGLNISGNNITNYGGSIYVGESTKANIFNNNIEPRGSVVNATSSAITIAGPASATTISGNKITMLALSLPLVNGIYIDDAYSTTIMNNEWGISTLASMKAATITANADNTLFFANSTNADSTNLLDYIVDSGVRTQYMGFKKSGGGFEIRRESVIDVTVFANSWVNFGGASANAGYFRDQFGIVHLVGAIKDGAIGNYAFVLPSGYRPPSPILLPIVTGAFGSRTFGAALIDTAGLVYIESGDNAAVSLDSISFRTY